MEDFDFFLEVGLLVFEGSSFGGQFILSVGEVRLNGSFLLSADGAVVFVVSNGGGQLDDNLLPLSELTFINLDFVFELELEVSGGGVGVNFVSLGLDDLSVDGGF